MGHTRIYLTAMTALLLPAGAGVMTVHASPTCEKFVKTYVSTPVRNRVSKATAQAWAKWRVGHPNWKPNPKVTRPRYKMSQHELLKRVDFACQVTTDPKVMDILFTPDDLHPPTPKLVPALETTDVTSPDTIPPMLAEMPPTVQNAFPPATGMGPYLPAMFAGAPIPPFGPPMQGLPPTQTGTPSSPGTPGAPGIPSSPGTPGTPVPPDTPVSETPVPPDVPVIPVVPVVPVSPVPEPSSLVLMVLGIGSGGATRMWRVRRNS
jgi:hypothetical protein